MAGVRGVGCGGGGAGAVAEFPSIARYEPFTRMDVKEPVLGGVMQHLGHQRFPVNHQTTNWKKSTLPLLAHAQVSQATSLNV